MIKHFADRLLDAIARKQAPVCAGLDPRLDWIPEEFYERAFEQLGRTPAAVRAAVREFCCEVIDMVEPFVPALKPQAAFFEALGPEGAADLGAICDHGRKKGLIIIADVKRGDIGTTAEAYAQSLFGGARVKGIELPSLHADCATINPYLGGDSIAPFVERALQEGCGLFILARTSNSGSAEFQELALAQGGTLVERVAAQINAWGAQSVGASGFSSVGAVVGATHLDAARRMRELMPRALFLVPGYGAQGGALETIRACFNTEGKGAIVNSSRGVMHAYATGPLKDYGMGRWREAVVEASKALARDISRLVS
ncbi:MAG: orotidine 5'-phosphate decarboxylase [Planctomycetota bacterium]|nr:orotidine-5'-phosphate decarboxylase [Planctomycetota bacterium]GIK51217.1 MAG: orotidine 5'-phosphate decarboxylase [Planctomycetota bacterium]